MPDDLLFKQVSAVFDLVNAGNFQGLVTHLKCITCANVRFTSEDGLINFFGAEVIGMFFYAFLSNHPDALIEPIFIEDSKRGTVVARFKLQGM